MIGMRLLGEIHVDAEKLKLALEQANLPMDSASLNVSSYEYMEMRLDAYRKISKYPSSFKLCGISIHKVED